MDWMDTRFYFPSPRGNNENCDPENGQKRKIATLLEQKKDNANK